MPLGCGHGWVYPLPNGQKARCGGPGICAACARDHAALRTTHHTSPPQVPSILKPTGTFEIEQATEGVYLTVSYPDGTEKRLAWFISPEAPEMFTRNLNTTRMAYHAMGQSGI